MATPLLVGLSQALPVRPRRIEDATHAGRVLAAAPTNRCVLPRWGINSPIRDHGAPPGRYTGTVGWTSREDYLGFTVPIAIGLRRDILKKHGVDPDTFRRWAEAKSLYSQEPRCGRTVIVRPITLAGLLQCHERTVKRCQRVARDLGLEIVTIPGRMLSEIECYKARKAGSPQRGLSTVSDFVVPSFMCRPVEDVTPTRGRSLSAYVRDLPAFGKSSAGSTGAPLRSAPPQQRRKRRRAGPAWDLACDLTQKVPWLSRCSPARITGQLHRYAHADLPWTANRLIQAMDALHRRLNVNAPTHAKTASWALLAWYLRQIDAVADHPALDRPLIPVIPWCGRCVSDTYRWLETDDRQPLRPCPDCSPQARVTTHS